MRVRAGYPDVVYFVKPSEENDELRISLRSLKNLNHGKIVIVGHKPTWVSDRIIHISTSQIEGEKYSNVRKNWLALLEDDRISDTFILMNDDFYIMQPTEVVEPLRRIKPLDHYIELFAQLQANSHYVETMRRAHDLLKEWGINNPDSYELHVPMLFEKQKVIELFDRVPENVGHTRTMYGNYYKLGGKRIEDVKIINDDQAITYDQRFLSTSDESYSHGKVGAYLRKKFAKVLIFSHANDPDGLLSVILAQLAFTDVEYLLTNSPQKDITKYLQEHDVSEYDYIFITDIYPGRPVLEALPNAYWFDHKQLSIDKIKQHNLILPNATIRIELNGQPTSGSELLYSWLRNNKLIGEESASFVEYIRAIDTWDFSGSLFNNGTY